MTAGKIDLHLHTTVSDGTDTPEELLENVRAAGFCAFAVTDHDAVKGDQIIRSLLKTGDPLFIPGVEFSCRDEKGKYHILGYGFDPESDGVQAVVRHGHALRMEKVVKRLDYLKTEFGFAFPREDVERLLALDNPGKPHIANLMVRCGYAKTKEQAFEQYLNRLHVKSGHVSPEEAIRGIRASGGVPVLAHPFYGSGDELILGDDMEERLVRLTAYGLKGIEAFYSGFSAKLTAQALKLAERFDLFVTAGSDYHGKNKMVALGDTGLNAAEFPERLKRFLALFET